MQRTLVLIALLFALLVAQVAAALDLRGPFDHAYDFLDEHVIGKTLIHKEVLSAESDDSMETEVIRRHTYTNLVKDASTFAFDVFSEVTETAYLLDTDGMRLVDRAVSERELSVTRWTLRKGRQAMISPEFSECLSHTESSSVGTRAIVHARWSRSSPNNLMLVSTTLTPARNYPKSSVHPRITRITVQEFQVAAGVLKSKSRENLYDGTDILFAEPGKVLASTERVWRVENPRPEWVGNFYAFLAHEESLLKALEEGGDETVFFVEQEDGHYYPCKVVGGLLESHPLQANVQSHFDSSSRRVVFSTLFLLKDLLNPPVAGTVLMEIWKDSEWVQLRDWKNSDTGSFLGKSEPQAAWEEASLNQIRFKIWWGTVTF